MVKKSTVFFIANLFFVCSAYAYTLTSGHPRIWFTGSDLSTYRVRTGSGGVHETLYGTLTTWCNTHISDSLSSTTDFQEHLSKYALAHIFDPEGNDTTYGDRVVYILNYMADNAQGWSNVWDEDTDRSGVDGDEWWEVPTSLAIAYDWAYDRINGSADESDIEVYLHTVIESDACTGGWSGTTCAAFDFDPSTYYKTEENWSAIILSLAIAGEQGSTENSQIAAVLAQAEDFLITAGNEWSGSYIRSNNYVSSDGWFLYTDGYAADVANSITYIAAWHTATTDNLLAYPFWCNFANSLEILLPGDGSFPKIGDVQPYGVQAKISDYENGIGALWYLAGAYYYSSDDSNSGGLLDILEALNGARANDDWNIIARLVWTIGTEDYTSLDRAYRYSRNGGFAARSGWDFTSSTDIVMWVGAVKGYPNAHWVNHTGHIDLHRGGDYLLVPGGAYTGAYYNDDTSYDYAEDSDSQNTILIGDIEHIIDSNDESFTAAEQADDEWGATSRFKYADGNYVYGLFDMTNAFLSADVNHSTGHVYRSVVFMDDQWIFVHDSISKVDAADSVRILWHMDDEPADDGSGWTDSGQTPSETGATSTDGSVFYWTTGSSKAYVRVVEPTSGVSLVKRGGSWDTAFVDIDGTSHTVPSFTYYHWGQWITETKIANPGVTDLDFLHVIQPVASAASEQTVERIASGSYIGACVRAAVRCAALFSEDGSDQNSASFSVTDTSGTIKVTIANMSAGTYSVNGSGSYVVDNNGLLYFTADLSVTNIFTIGEISSTPTYGGIQFNGVYGQ